jgi:peptidoglycan/LPS O-acetylase OafA/YrhL
MVSTTSPGRRQLANKVAIVIGIAMLALALWGGTAKGVSDTGEARFAGVPWFTHFIAGALTLAGVFTAQRWRQRRLAQLCFIAAAVLLLGALAVFRYFGPWAWLTLVLPAVALLVAAPFLAPVPPPTDQRP